jgi:hypothetical protein
MTQDDWILLLLKIGLIAGAVSLFAWVAVYSWLTRGGAWKNPIGQTLIVKTLLIAGLFVPQILSLFFRLNRFDSHIVAWTDVALIGLVSPVMIWRSWVWVRLSRAGTAGQAGEDAAAARPLPDGTGKGASGDNAL